MQLQRQLRELSHLTPEDINRNATLYLSRKTSFKPAKYYIKCDLLHLKRMFSITVLSLLFL